MQDALAGFNVANRLQKRSLLIAINALASLSIFFFGYDQGQSKLAVAPLQDKLSKYPTGMMGSVNNAPHYIQTM